MRPIAVVGLVSAAVATVAVAGGARWFARTNQAPDDGFDPTVARPAYAPAAARHPVVAVDAGHHNFHTADGRYKPFADLIRSDGYIITPNRQPFTAASLKPFDRPLSRDCRPMA